MVVHNTLIFGNNLHFNLNFKQDLGRNLYFSIHIEEQTLL